MKKAILTIAALAAAGQVAAYQVEVSGEVNTNDYVDSFMVGGDYYLNPVSQNTGPWAEAAFLEKASYVGVHFIDLDDNSGMLAKGRYHINEQFFFDAGVTFGDLDSVIVGGGLYLDSSTTIAAHIEDGDDLDTFSADYKQLIFRNDGTYLNMDLGVSHKSYDNNGAFDDQDMTRVTAGGDYYLDKATSIGGEVGLAFGDIDGKSFQVRAERFLQDNIAINGGIEFADYDNTDSDTGLIFGATARF